MLQAFAPHKCCLFRCFPNIRHICDEHVMLKEVKNSHRSNYGRTDSSQCCHGAVYLLVKHSHQNPSVWIRLGYCDGLSITKKKSAVSFPPKFAVSKTASVRKVLVTFSESKRVSSLIWVLHTGSTLHHRVATEVCHMGHSGQANLTWLTTGVSASTVLQVVHRLPVPPWDLVSSFELTGTKSDGFALFVFRGELVFYFILYDLCVQIFNNTDVTKRDILSRNTEA